MFDLTQFLPTIDWTFWHWAIIGAAVSAAAIALAWFFAPLRSLAGAVIMAVVAALFAYKRGEKDQKAKDKPPQPRTPLWPWF